MAESLWKIGHVFSLNNRKRAPIFRIDGLSEVILRYADFEYTDYSKAPDWKQLAPFDRWLEYSMTFNPGEGWFGASPGFYR